MKLSISFCVVHKFRCGAAVDVQARTRDAETIQDELPGAVLLNDIAWHSGEPSINFAAIPVTKDPTAVCIRDGKRPDGLSVTDPVATCKPRSPALLSEVTVHRGDCTLPWPMRIC